MSYDIQLYRKETKDRQQQSQDENFFDSESNLVPFNEEQLESLKESLEDYEYELVNDKPGQWEYQHTEFSITALLTRKGLYFAAAFNEDAIFEAGMTASELTDTDEFVKYDPQNGGWQAD